MERIKHFIVTDLSTNTVLYSGKDERIANQIYDDHIKASWKAISLTTIFEAPINEELEKAVRRAKK